MPRCPGPGFVPPTSCVPGERGCCTDSSHVCQHRGAWVRVGDGASGWTLSLSLAAWCLGKCGWVTAGGRSGVAGSGVVPWWGG